MAQEATVYCGSCGGALSATARFCRACGASQEEFTETSRAPVATPIRSPVTGAQPQAGPTLPPPPVPVASSSPSRSAAVTVLAILAILGGAGMVLIVLHHDVYYPLHHHNPVNWGDPPQFGDLLALISGAVSMALGGVTLRTRPASPLATGIALIVAGVPTLVLALLWAYPETFHLNEYPEQPFYYGYSYFEEFGQTQIGDGYVQLPLVLSSVGVSLAGVLMTVAATRARRRGIDGPVTACGRR